MAERDTRFGGNIERANRGIPYPTGGRDVRFEGSLPPNLSLSAIKLFLPLLLKFYELLP